MAAIVVSNLANSGKFVQGMIQPVIPVSAATTLTAAQSGSIISITPSAGGYTITLPAPTTAGMRFRFVQAANAAGATAITSTGANVRFKGLANAAQVASAGCTTVNIVGNAANSVGDWVEMWSDGTNYFATGLSQVAAGFTTA